MFRAIFTGVCGLAFVTALAACSSSNSSGMGQDAGQWADAASGGETSTGSDAASGGSPDAAVSADGGGPVDDAAVADGAGSGGGDGSGTDAEGGVGYGIVAALTFPPDPPKPNAYKDNLAASFTGGVTLLTASRPAGGSNEILTLSIVNMGQTGTFGGGDADATYFGYQNGFPPHQTTNCSITVTKAGTATGDEVAGTFSAIFPSQGTYPNGTRELDVTAGSFRFKLN